ncbi:hypothetical protein OS493_000796 [Desmophyllum pertusum]|uniref:Uncharacterized protein n=1 Tax=Desmophyllum pertusum TaxID=174260 RepID=A0A9W9ZTJ2_9CNID|nr:hypothetical protein OS493_000796 [Desmophyllum pertusum]
MAGNSNIGDKFLSPAYFQVARPKIPSKKADAAATKLLPPSEYNAVKDQGEESARALAEINKLQNENKQLRVQLERSKQEELRLEGEIRKSRLLVQKGRVDDALDLKRMAELQEENFRCNRDLKEMKGNFETDLERTEAELEKANSIIKELKAELRQKEEVFERELESLEKRSRKQMSLVKNLKGEIKNAEEQVKIDRKGFEDVLKLSSKLEEQMISHQREVQNLTGKLRRKDEELKAQSSVVDQLRAYIGENLPNTQMEKLQKRMK